MRSLAIARFRLLTAVRSSDWVFGMALLSVVVPTVVASSVSVPSSWYPPIAQATLRSGSQGLIAAYLVHAFLLMIAAQVLGQATTTWGEMIETNDLIDTAPVDHAGRFVGEAAGIAGALLVVHIATLPLFLFAAALTTVPALAIALAEAGMVFLTVFFSIVAASAKRDLKTAWGRSRPIRAMASVVVLIVVALAITTRLIAFRDGAFFFLGEPSPRSWHALTATVYNPWLLAALVTSIFAGAIAFFYLHAVRLRSTR